MAPVFPRQTAPLFLRELGNESTRVQRGEKLMAQGKWGQPGQKGYGWVRLAEEQR